MESWKDIQGYEGYYQISNKGRVKSLSRTWIGKTKTGEDRICVTKERIIKPYIHNGVRSNIKPTMVYILRKDGKNKHFFAHRLVAIHFIENDDINLKIEVNHKDGNRLNNDVSNLEWVSKKDNILHAFKNKLIKTQKKVSQIDCNTGNIINVFESESEACRKLGVSQGKIGRAIKRNGTCMGYKWQYI